MGACANPAVLYPSNEMYYIPLEWLSIDTVTALSHIMDRPFSLPNQDMEAFLKILGYEEKSQEIMQARSPTIALIELWSGDSKSRKNPTMGMLLEVLHQLNRFDVVFDIQDAFKADLHSWRQRQEEMERRGMELAEQEPAEVPRITRLDVLNDDELVFYDAVFSFDTGNTFSVGVMRQISSALKTLYNLTLSEGAMNLQVGVPVMEGFMTLVKQRCSRVIVLLTHSYVKSETFLQQLQFARYKSIVEKKVIPVKVERDVAVPTVLKNIVCIPFYLPSQRKNAYESIKNDIAHRQLNQKSPLISEAAAEVEKPSSCCVS